MHDSGSIVWLGQKALYSGNTSILFPLLPPLGLKKEHKELSAFSGFIYKRLAPGLSRPNGAVRPLLVFFLQTTNYCKYTPILNTILIYPLSQS